MTLIYATAATELKFLDFYKIAETTVAFNVWVKDILLFSLIIMYLALIHLLY